MKINKICQQASFGYPLGNFLNPALALLGQGLKKSPSRQKLDFANHLYLCKGPNLKLSISDLKLYLRIYDSIIQTT
jgi:hypothetical protein